MITEKTKGEKESPIENQRERMANKQLGDSSINQLKLFLEPLLRFIKLIAIRAGLTIPK